MFERDASHSARSPLMTEPVHIFFFEGPSHVIKLANALSCELVGERSVFGKPYREAFPELADQMVPLLDRTYASGGTHEADGLPVGLLGVRAETKGERHYKTKLQALCNRLGTVTGILAVTVEVSGQAATLKHDRPTPKVSPNDDPYRQLADAIPLVLWFERADDHSLEYVNPRWVEYMGTTLATAAVQSWEARVYPEDHARLRRLRGSPNGTEPYSDEVRLRGADAKYRHFRVRIVPVRDGSGHVVRYLGTAADIEDQKRVESESAQLLASELAARAELEFANRMKDEFLARLSHELRTPLAAITMWTHVLRAGKRSDRTAALDAIEKSAQSQHKLIEDLLDVSRGISGKLRVDVRSIQARSPIEGALSAVRPLAEAKAIRLEAVLPAKSVRILGDTHRVQQIVTNLLSNAVKFTPSGGRVELKVEPESAFLRIIVSDDGQGITPEFLPHIFTPFRQANATFNSPLGGLGLGLSIVRQLVDLHGGTVRADSNGPGEGSTFTVRIPLAADTRRSQLQKLAAKIDDSATIRGIKVLLVDDDDRARDGVALVLEGYGARVTTARGASEALTKIQEQCPDVLVSDIAMPGEDGYSLIRKVRATIDERISHVPAAALTAHARSEDKTRALDAGFNTHIAKPVDPSELVNIIAGLARKREREPRRRARPPDSRSALDPIGELPGEPGGHRHDRHLRVDPDAGRQNGAIGHVEAFAPRTSRRTSRPRRGAHRWPFARYPAGERPCTRSVARREGRAPPFLRRPSTVMADDPKIGQVHFARATGEGHLGQDCHRMTQAKQIARGHAVGSTGSRPVPRRTAPPPSSWTIAPKTAVMRHLRDVLRCSGPTPGAPRRAR